MWAYLAIAFLCGCYFGVAVMCLMAMAGRER